jgi:hypothetical protein
MEQISLHKKLKAQRLNEKCTVKAIIGPHDIGCQIKSIEFCCHSIRRLFTRLDTLDIYQYAPKDGEMPEWYFMFNTYVHSHDGPPLRNTDRVDINLNYCNHCGAEVDVQVEDQR